MISKHESVNHEQKRSDYFCIQGGEEGEGVRSFGWYEALNDTPLPYNRKSKLKVLTACSSQRAPSAPASCRAVPTGWRQILENKSIPVMAAGPGCGLVAPGGVLVLQAETEHPLGQGRGSVGQCSGAQAAVPHLPGSSDEVRNEEVYSGLSCLQSETEHH